MGECIGRIAHDAASSLTTHKPSKSFGDLFEEKKAQLESLQAGLARAVLPKTPPMPAVKHIDFGIGVDFHKTLLPMMPLCPAPNICMVFDIMGGSLYEHQHLLDRYTCSPLRPSITNSMLLV